MPWSHSADALTRARERAGQGWQLWALEGGAGAESLLESQVLGQDQKILLIVGHEVSGVDARLLDLAERRVFLPMAGVKGSLNVGVATAIAAYAIRRQLREKLSRSSSPPES